MCCPTNKVIKGDKKNFSSSCLGGLHGDKLGEIVQAMAPANVETVHQSSLFHMTPPRNSGGIPQVSIRFSLSMEMSRLTPRDQILRRERGQGNIHFPWTADHVQDWQPYPVDPYSCYVCDHAYIESNPDQLVYFIDWF